MSRRQEQLSEGALSYFAVMAGLVPAIHAFCKPENGRLKTWMRGSSPRMTNGKGRCECPENIRRSHRQRGAVLITIMVVMMVTMLLASTLINHFAVQEARAIEQQLADIRAYWAMMGHVNYALSRASNTPCGATCADDAARADVFNGANGLFGELITFPSGSARRWAYSEYGATTYYFDVQAAVDADVTSNGKLRLHMSIPTVGDFASLAGFKAADMWVDICLTDGSGSCSASLTAVQNGKSLITGVLRSNPGSPL